jgi:hypothetical protein
LRGVVSLKTLVFLTLTTALRMNTKKKKMKGVQMSSLTTMIPVMRRRCPKKRIEREERREERKV